MLRRYNSQELLKKLSLPERQIWYWKSVHGFMASSSNAVISVHILYSPYKTDFLIVKELDRHKDISFSS